MRACMHALCAWSSLFNLNTSAKMQARCLEDGCTETIDGESDCRLFAMIFLHRGPPCDLAGAAAGRGATVSLGARFHGNCMLPADAVCVCYGSEFRSLRASDYRFRGLVPRV